MSLSGPDDLSPHFRQTLFQDGQLLISLNLPCAHFFAALTKNASDLPKRCYILPARFDLKIDGESSYYLRILRLRL
ncbi:MAG: hypothetical protein LUP01_03935, partial [Methanothrix sp.]|nr:hypothetical protein [Methanothrix sp.]